MKSIDRLERRWGRYALPHLTEILILGQVLMYVLRVQRPEILERMALVPARVLEGELVRVVTFVFQPPLMNPLFAFFFWYLFYLMGTTLEVTWGTFRYNLFLLIGYLATVAVSFVTPESEASVAFLQGAVFLAFAYLYPDFQLLLFFVLPVKIKWLALLAWISYFLVLALGPWPAKLAVAASLSGFLAFFGRDLWSRIRSGRRRMGERSRRIKQARTPRHVCRICGLNNLTDPNMDFRYCSQCADSSCYCQEHLRNHEHVAAGEGTAER